jgi:glycosyltransferase involved in cell wall biosynthesis
MKPLTVLYAHSSAEWYGSDVALFNLATRLPGDIRPIVVLPEEGPLAGRLRARGVACHVFALAVPRKYDFAVRRWHRVLWLPVEWLVCWRRLGRLLRREHVDIVHVNVSILLGAAWVARRHRCPLVWHWREVLAGEGRWRPLLIAAATRWASRILCVSNAVRDQFGDTDRAVVVFDAIDPPPADDGDPAQLREELGIGADDICLGTVGRLSDRKGHDVLLRAAPRIIQRFPSARFVIVGEVYRKNVKVRRTLERLVDALDLREHVRFAGFRSDIGAVMRMLDLFVFPSKQPEGFGIVQLEAMARGIPVVASTAGGTRDVVVDGETGRLVTPDDSERLAETIIELLNDPERRRAMGQKGRRLVLERFTLDRQVETVAAVYREVARADAARPDRPTGLDTSAGPRVDG